MARMRAIPKPESFPAIRRSLRFYQVCAYVTGIMLLLLCAEMVVKYGFDTELEAGSAGLVFVPRDTVQGFNVSTGVLIAHGWFYVVYAISCYLVWYRMRWELLWLVAMLGGGVVPFLSFVTEALMTRRTRRQLVEFQAAYDEVADEDARLASVEAALGDDDRARLDAEVESESRRRAGRG